MSWTSVSVRKYIQTLFRCLALSQPHLAPIKAELLITAWQSGTRNHCSAARLSSCLHVHAHATTPNTTLLPLWSPAELHIPLGPLCLRVILLPAASGPWFRRFIIWVVFMFIKHRVEGNETSTTGCWMDAWQDEWMNGWMDATGGSTPLSGGWGMLCGLCGPV